MQSFSPESIMKTQPRIGVVQTNSSKHWDDNLAFALASIEQAAAQGLDLVAFPEMFLLIDDQPKLKFSVAQSLEGKVVQAFQQKAQTHQISILLGSLYEAIPEDPEHLYNTSILLNRQGEIQGVYRKIHLCDINSPHLKNLESQTIRAGKDIVVVDHEIGKIGMTICYDLRFPSLFQKLRQSGAEIIMVPSAFFLQTGKHHWFPLLQARAIENQVYIVAPAQWGKHSPDHRMSYGHSVIIDPWGTVVACASEGTGLISAAINHDYLRQIRESMPVVEHRRMECYFS